MKPTPLNAAERDLIVRYRRLTQEQRNSIHNEIAFLERIKAAEQSFIKATKAAACPAKTVENDCQTKVARPEFSTADKSA